MTFIVGPHEQVARNGGSFQECSVGSGLFEYLAVQQRYGRYCTIKDYEYAPPTSRPGRKWVQLYRTPDNTE